MKGIIFNHLTDMVEEVFGLETWDMILQEANSEGIFVATETYSDKDLLALVAAAHKLSGIPVNDLVRKFGEYMFPKFEQSNPQFFSPDMSLKSFLLSVDRIIHVEVRKLHPDAMLPEFEYKDEEDNELTMYYNSPRKLCYLAEGLIAGAASHFNTEYTLDHSACMHDGADACTLHITVLDS